MKEVYVFNIGTTGTRGQLQIRTNIATALTPSGEGKGLEENILKDNCN
jgi:hypothetical protein